MSSNGKLRHAFLVWLTLRTKRRCFLVDSSGFEILFGGSPQKGNETHRLFKPDVKPIGYAFLVWLTQGVCRVTVQVSKWSSKAVPTAAQIWPYATMYTLKYGKKR